jgi:hypothetical protein
MTEAPEAVRPASTSRRAIAATLGERVPYTSSKNAPAPILWLDAGNARNSGQVLLGNALHPDQLHGAFDSADEVCFALPAPSLQRPDLLTAYVERLMDGTCRWMATYLDLDDGSFASSLLSPTMSPRSLDFIQTPS